MSGYVWSMQFWKAIRRRLEQFGPYPSLLILAIPLAVVEPFKLVAVLIAGGGHFLTGLVFLVVAYVVGPRRYRAAVHRPKAEAFDAAVVCKIVVVVCGAAPPRAALVAQLLDAGRQVLIWSLAFRAADSRTSRRRSPQRAPDFVWATVFVPARPPRQARPVFRAMASTRSTSDARSSLSEILTKASAIRNACGSNAIDFVANEDRLVSDAPAKNSEIGTSSAVATK